MRICLIFMVLLLCLTAAYAENGMLQAYGEGAFALIDEESDSPVHLKEQIVIVTLREDYYRISSTFVFHNDSRSARRHWVGFPAWRYGSPQEIRYQDFSTTVNGHKVDFVRHHGQKKGSKSVSGLWGEVMHLDRWVAREVTFPAFSDTRMSVDYSVPYQQRRAWYLFGPAGSWAGPIETLTVTIDSTLNIYIHELRFYESDPHLAIEQTGPTTYQLTMRNVEPDPYAQFEIKIIPFNPPEQKVFFSFGPMVWDFDQYFFTDFIEDYNTLVFATVEQLRYIHNWFYAWNGHIFKDKSVQEYFERYGWYRPNEKFTEADFSEIEKANVQTVLEFMERKSRF
jgi:hypothetical protein